MKSIVEQVVNSNKKDKIALTDGKRSITFYELEGLIYKFSSILWERYGLKKGDRVIVAADKQLEFVPLYFACHLLQVIVLPVAPDINKSRYEHIKGTVAPSMVIGFNDSDDTLIRAKLDEFSISDYIDSVNKKQNLVRGYEERVDMDAVADIMFTTGTTGEPKGVQLSQRNIAAAANNINTFIGNTYDDVEMIALPISHSFGIGRMRCALSNGQTVVLLGSFANVKRFFRFMSEYKVTGFGMVPASWAMLKRLSGMKIAEYKDQLNYLEFGSAPMPIEEKRLLMESLPSTRICMHFGLTEASRSAFMEFHEEKDHLNTVGKESPNMSIVIKDENGHDVSIGTEGEICVSGDAVTVGYLNIPKEECFWGSYFRTGDWGFKDGEGYITLCSRKKELINVGGRKVSPVEVEEVLKGIEFIEDCACVAVEDPNGILGEVVKAYVVTDHPEELNVENMNKLIGGQIEDYKYPVAYEVISEIPKTSSGKIQRLSLVKG